jgi:outer membrane protein TolC
MAFALQCSKALRFSALLACCYASAGVSAVVAAPDGGLPGAVASDAAAPLQRPVAPLPVIPQHGEFELTPRLLLQLALARNADTLYSQLATEVAGHLAQAEMGVFEVVAYGGLRHEDRKRQRSAQELDLNNLLSKQFIIDEQVDLAEMGVKRRISTGGELSLSYRLTQRSNNLIQTIKSEDTEYDGALALVFKQPLLRGFGSAAVEADRKIAELEWSVGKQQYKQQMLRSGSEALASYWQLYRAHETLRIRRDTLRKAETARSDIEARIRSGHLPPRTAFEARSAVASRSAETLRAEQNVSEAETKIKTLLNLSAGDYAGLRLLPATQAAQSQAAPVVVADAQRLEQALSHWPSYRIANLKRQQGQIRLDFAGNQKRPQLDLAASCSSTYLSYESSNTAEKVFKGDYPDCYIGFNMEIPLEGNLRAKSQFQAQRVRLYQSDIEIEAVRTTLANDLELRTRQLERAGQEVAEYRKDVELREQMLEMERQQFQFGMSRLSQVIARENELNASREGLLDSLARLELARVALQVADGSLFGEYAVEWHGD